MQPLAVIVEVLHTESAKSKNAVVAVGPVDATAALPKVLPAATYAVPVTSLLVVYAVLVASIVAEELYRAILNVSAVVAARITVATKAWFALSISVLNDVQIAEVIAMRISLYFVDDAGHITMSLQV